MFDLFRLLGTQWRVGASGATGLDYNVLLRVMERRGLSNQQFDEMFEDIRLMESESLAAMHDKP